MSARANWPVATSRLAVADAERDASARSSRKAIVKRGAGPDRREELDDRKPRRRADRRRPARVGGGRLDHLGEQRDAGQHRPAGEVAGEGRMVGGDLEPLRRAARSSRLVASATIAAGAVRRRELGEPCSRSACRSARAAAPRPGRCAAAGTPRRRGRAAPRGSARAPTPGRDDERHQPGDAGGVGRRSRAGIQNAPSTTPSIALRWKFRWPSELRLPATLIRSFERPSRRKRSASRTSSTSASGVGCGTWPPLTIAASPSPPRRRPSKVLPLGAGGRAPGRDLAGLGAAVDLEQRRAEGRSRRARRAAATSGAVAQTTSVDRRQRQARLEQRLQVERRRHQRRAAPACAASAATMSAGIERPPGVERRAAVQRDQHARLEAVHVLRRHRRDQRSRRPGRVAAERVGQARRLGPRRCATSRPQGLACGTGSPVEPEVSTWAATRSAVDRGNGGDAAPLAAARAHGRRVGRPSPSPSAFDQGIGAGEARAQPRDRVGVWFGGSRLVWPRSSAAPRPTAKR